MRGGGPGEVFGFNDPGFSKQIYDKVIAKLKTEAIEDFRIDFEDGYGNRSNEEEDETAVTAAKEVAKGMTGKTLHHLSASASNLLLKK